MFRDDLIGFLNEANRVVRFDGYLILDSPSRDISQQFGYTQPRHVLEFSVDEAIRLTEAAGFEIQEVKGIWSCADQDWLHPDIFDISDTRARMII